MTDNRTSDTTTRLADLVGDIPVAMVTTVDATGALNARPLTVKRIDDDGAVWFLVDANAEWSPRASSP
jgi:general stress protein 26